MKRVLFVIALFWSLQYMMAQNAPSLPKQATVYKPAVLKPSSGSTYKKTDLERELCSENKWGLKKTVKEKEREFWCVYSDRNNNPLYGDVAGTQKLTTSLGFKDAVIIADIKNNMALVYLDPKMGKWPNISEKAKSLGWIPMENLLLWDICPTDERGVQYKALIAIHLNELKGKVFEGVFYEDPVSTDNPKNLQMDMKFYFRMKESDDGQRTLLSTSPSDQSNGLYGWVDKSSYTNWDQRACLEPNWDNNYATKHENFEVRVYSNENMENSDIVTRWRYGEPNGDKDRTSRYRMAPAQLRFPILGQINEEINLIHCTSFSSKLGNNMANFDSDSRSIIEDVDVVRKMRRQMNIIFVVEATAEMQEVLPAIKESVMKCQNYYGQGLKIQVGVVLYKGVDMGEDGIEIVALSDFDDPLLISMFDSKNAESKLSARERDVSLALAIEKATDPVLMGFNKNQNNLLLVIGNRGASDEDSPVFESDQLQDVLYDNNIQIMSVQLKRQGGNSSWGNYYDQMSELIRINVNRQYASIGDNARFVSHSNDKKEADGHDFISTKNKEKSVLFAQMRFPLSGKELTPIEITQYIDDGINMFAVAAQNWNSYFEQSLGKIDFDPAFLKNYLGEDGYKSWEKVQAISAFDGYTKKIDPDGEEYWHYILYLSTQELETLLSKLKGAYEVAKKQEDNRKPYVEAMREIIKTQLGQQKDKSIDTMSADSLQKLIYGLNVHTDITNLRSLKEIQDQRVVTTVEYKKMLKKFSDNYKKLEDILHENYRYKTDIGKESYYWVPIEDLP